MNDRLQKKIDGYERHIRNYINLQETQLKGRTPPKEAVIIQIQYLAKSEERRTLIISEVLKRIYEEGKEGKLIQIPLFG